ncbi:peptidylprolyl isomerase [Jatrophihabitans fulvus]
MVTDKQRRAAERRRLQRQLERRRERELRRRRFTLIASIVGVVVVVGVVAGLLVATSGSDDDTPAASTPPSGSPTTAAAAGLCTWTSSGDAARKVTPPTTTNPPDTGTVSVSLRTSRGTIGLKLNRAKAPCAVASFLSLAKQKYYDRTPCHRVTTGPTLYVLQCGDPTGSGSGGPGYSFGDELIGDEKYTKGVLAMANAGPDTNGSQFFLVYKNSTLKPDYTVFGTITSGLGIIDKVAAAGVATGGPDGKPKLPIDITSVTRAK